MQIPDSTICSLLNQGEEKGMEYLFTRYYKPLVLWAASFLNNIPQSEDLVQDFFIRLWEKRTQTSLQATTFKSFLYTSVRNLAFDRMEKKDPLRHATDLKSSDKAWEEYDTLEEEVLARVKNEIDKLPERSRQIQNITSKDLDVRLDPQTVPIELEQLVLSFNHMIERIEDVFTRQSNFSADIAHEIRTPITNLITQTEIALSQSRSQKELEDVLYSNLEELTRMAKMVSDMLFLAQADNNQLIPEKKMLNLADEIGKVFDFFEALAEDRGVELRFVGDECQVAGDPLMLRRALSNLLSNALRYTPPGEAIVVRCQTVDHQVQVSVENPGTPIAPEHLPRLFDRFYRVDPSRQRKGEGSGIGLAIVKSIVVAHKGTVAVTSDARGTRFVITLPA